jgi:hypothetical protein
MESKMLDLLACPVCLGRLIFDNAEKLGCECCGRRYPVQDGIPVLLAERAVVAS